MAEDAVKAELFRAYEEFMAVRMPDLPDGQEVFSRSDVIKAWAGAANSALTFIARQVVLDTQNDCLRAEVAAWRERFPSAGYDGISIVLSG